jgi:hypothetical protein
MGEQYHMTLENGTDQPWHFGFYQKHPSSPGLTSVAWQVRGIPPQAGSVPSSAQVTWTLDYGLCIANFDKDGRKYTGKQFAPAYLGNVYKVATLDGIPSIDTKPTAMGSSDQIVLKNNTGPYATALTMGFTASNNIIAVEDGVGGEQETIYRVHPTYYVACYRNIVLGQLVDEGVVIGPVEVKFSEGGTKSTKVVASKDAGGNYRLNVVPM